MFNKAKFGKILRGAGLAAGGTALTFLLEAVPNLDFGVYAPIVTAVLSVLLNVVRQAVRNDV